MTDEVDPLQQTRDNFMMGSTLLKEVADHLTLAIDYPELRSSIEWSEKYLEKMNFMSTAFIAILGDMAGEDVVTDLLNVIEHRE